MATKLIIKNKSGAVPNPQPSDLEFGELALNYTSGQLFYKNSDGTVKILNDPPPGGSGSGTDADLLDGIDSTQFLRSDVSDEYTNGTLTFESGTTQTFANGANVNFNNTGVGRLEATLTSGTSLVTVDSTTGLVAGQTLTKISGDGDFGVAATILTVNNGTEFTASVNHLTSGDIVFSAGRSPFTVVSSVRVDNLNADLLDGRSSEYFYSPDNPPDIPATLQDVTDNGNTTDNIIEITNETQSISPETGALVVAGGVGIGKDLHIGGTLHLVNSTSTILIEDVDFKNWDGKTYYVSKAGSDTLSGYTGKQYWASFNTIKRALEEAEFGDTVLVAPGEYIEEFPLVVPKGVSVRGSGIRESQISPTIDTNDQDAFLLSGDTTVSDFTIKNYFYNSTNDTGYAFKFQENSSVTARSTYIQRCTIITRGSTVTGSDPYGFNSGDAGRGAYIDGAKISRNSIEAAMLFNEVTFIVPNSKGIILTNGARSEILTCFFYFSDLALEGVVGTEGRGEDGKTYITLQGRTGTWSNGSTLQYYDTDGTTLLASATIESITGDKITIDGSASGFATVLSRPPKNILVAGDAKISTATQRFGTGSLLLDGDGDYLSIESNPDFAFGANDFTIEMWVYRVGNNISQPLVDMRTASPTIYAPLLLINTSNQIVYNDGSSNVITGGSISSETWTHIALSRQGTSTRLFVNGTQSGSTFTDNRIYVQSPLRIGARFDATTAFNGRIDELRITKGLARYTGTFTPSNNAFVGDRNTVLLLHFDGSDESTTFIDDTTDIQDIRCSAGGTATGIIRYDRSEFAAEVRTISCAFVYGNQGVRADGPDVLLQLMAHNFAYIGTGADLTNDKSAVVRSNEVIEVNGGKVYYNSVDQAGDFRVGEFFSVNFQTGAVTFTGGTFDVSALGSINFTDGVNSTIVQASGITTNNLVLAGNTVSTLSGNLILDPSGSNSIILNSDTTVNGTLTATTLEVANLRLTEYVDGPPGTGTAGTYSEATDYIITYTKNLTLTTDWLDTGIRSNDLPTGTYLIQLFANDTSAGGTSSNEYYTGNMSWFAGTTTGAAGTPSDEIVLHRAGGSSTGNIFLRTLRTTSGDNLKLQIYANQASSGPSNYVFKFRKML